MKKTLFTLITIIIMASLSITAKTKVCEVSVEKFDKVEMNVEALISIIKSDTCRVSVDTMDIKYLDLIVMDNILKVSYSKPYYKEMLKNSPVILNLWLPDSVKVVTTREYELKKTKD